MELIQFIKENQINNLQTLKTILETKPYNLKIKEDESYPNLFLIHSKEDSDFSIKLVNECNGIILDKNTFKVLCYTFDKCKDDINIPQNMNINDMYFEYALESTLIRAFYYEDKWIFSTKKCIDGNKARWLSLKSFVELFFDYIKNYDIFQNLNTSYCYSFLLTHPENNIVVQYNQINVYHLNTRDMDTLQEIDINIGLNKLARMKIDPDNLESMLLQISSDKNLCYEGIMFIDSNYNRWKIRTPVFLYVRSLWGNSNNRFFRYLELRKDTDLLKEYLNYFSQDKDNFVNYEVRISNFAKNLLEYYMAKHITKTNKKLPYYFVKIIYELHGEYLKDRIITDYNKIMLKLLSLDAKKLCYMFNQEEKYNLQLNNMMDESDNNKLSDNIEIPIM